MTVRQLHCHAGRVRNEPEPIH